MIKTRMKSHNCGELNLNNLNEEVVLSGWAATIRDLGGILFVELRDRSGFFQIVANPQINPEVHKVLEKVRTEYVITVKGKVSKRPEETYNENILQARLKCILKVSKSFRKQKLCRLYWMMKMFRKMSVLNTDTLILDVMR